MESFPKRITVELTNRCNLSCEMCPRHHVEMPLGDMCYETLYTILADLIASEATATCTVFPFWRGESLLHNDFSAMVHLVDTNSKEQIFATNGLLIPENPTWLHSFSTISVSIHRFLSVRGMLRLLMARLPNDKPRIVASKVAGEDVKFVDWSIVANYSDNGLRVYSEHSHGGTWGKIENISPKYKPTRDWCRRLDTDLVIAWDGSVSRCCYVWETIAELNVNEIPISEIWHSPQFEAIRDDYPDEICSQCDQWRGYGATL